MEAELASILSGEAPPTVAPLLLSPSLWSRPLPSSNPSQRSPKRERRPQRLLDDGVVPLRSGEPDGPPLGRTRRRRDLRRIPGRLRTLDWRRPLAQGGGPDRRRRRRGPDRPCDGGLPRRRPARQGHDPAPSRRRPPPRGRPAQRRSPSSPRTNSTPGHGQRGDDRGDGRRAGSILPEEAPCPPSPPLRQPPRWPRLDRRPRPALEVHRRLAAEPASAARPKSESPVPVARTAPPAPRAGRAGGPGDGREPDAADGPGGRIAGPDASAPPVRRLAAGAQAAPDGAAARPSRPWRTAATRDGAGSAVLADRAGEGQGRPAECRRGLNARSRSSRTSPGGARTSPAGSTTRSSPAGCARWPTGSAASPGWSATWPGSSARRSGSRSAASTTGVDRDILEKLESPAQPPDPQRPRPRHRVARAARGRRQGPRRGRSAWRPATARGCSRSPSADDGRGIDPERLRAKVVERGLAGAEMAEQLTEAELLEFLFLPGFSTKEAVTELSGRGVGLDVVQSMVQAVGGIGPRQPRSSARGRASRSSCRSRCRSSGPSWSGSPASRMPSRSTGSTGSWSSRGPRCEPLEGPPALRAGRPAGRPGRRRPRSWSCPPAEVRADDLSGGRRQRPRPPLRHGRRRLPRRARPGGPAARRRGWARCPTSAAPRSSRTAGRS